MVEARPGDGVGSGQGAAAIADGGAVGGGNDVRPSPGSGGPPPDDLCQGSPVCLGIQAVRSEYRDVQILATDRSDIDGSPGQMVSGLATNRSGLRIRFLAIAVAEPARTYSILGFTDARADPALVLPPTQAIVGSFQAPSS
jgi:hypothetical protein